MHYTAMSLSVVKVEKQPRLSGKHWLMRARNKQNVFEKYYALGSIKHWESYF